MFARLERAAQFIHRNLIILGSAAVIIAVAVTLVDVRTQGLEKILSYDRIEGLGGALGKVAVLLAALAILYYVVRESYVTARANKLKLPGWLESVAVRAVGMFRLTHPLTGVLVFSLVFLHGYLMWWVWAAGNYSLAVITGLIAGLVLAVLALTGIGIRTMPKRLSVRLFHRLGGLLFIIALVVHRVFGG